MNSPVTYLIALKTLGLCLFGLLLPCAAQETLHFNLSDSPPSTSTGQAPFPPDSVFHLDDHVYPSQPGFPSCVSTDSGHPRKPVIDRAGDRDRSDNPPERYGLPNQERAGHPQQVAWWAIPAINKQYSACYVGGGTAWVLPWLVRPRCRYEEGTWGLDYDGLYKPRRVWLRWSGQRSQGGIGQYEADYEPGLVKLLKEKAGGHAERGSGAR